MRVDFTKYALLDPHCYGDRVDNGKIEEAIRATIEIEDDRFYLDKKRMTFRFLDPILDEQNTDPQYWSEATLRIWRDRVCYD